MTDPRPSVSSRRRVAVLAILGLSAAPAFAQVSVPTGRQQYMVLGYEQHVYNMMARVATGEGLPIAGNRMNSVVSLVASADGQILYYDHWEDGYEADPFVPTQPSTLILGDGNPVNGDACVWTVGGCGGDLIVTGMPITLNSNLATGTGSCTTGVQVTCNVPVNPRLPADVRFDGGDSIATSGGPLSLIHNQDPISPFIGGATEILPRQAFANATSYSIPAGEDLYLGNNTVTEPFKYVAVDLVAFDDATQVFINSPGAGTVSITLNKGQHYASCGAVSPCVGAIDGAAAAGITINAATRISTTGPVAGLILTGGDGTYATDFFPILPDLLHGTDYLIPSVGDNAGVNGNRPMNLYLFNPDPLNAITVTVVDSVGAVNINVPANSTVDYFTGIQTATGTGRFVPANSTVRLTSSRPFWGLTAQDHQSAANDWGYSWLSSRFLTQSYTVSYAPGVQDPPSAPRCSPAPCDSLNRAPVWVGATQDFTQVRIDFDNDGLYDEVDTDSNDTPNPGAPDPSCNPATPNCLYTINALQALRVYDYTDYDNTGTRIVASAPVAVAYGQDTDQATGPDPIIDTGYTIYPIIQRFLDPVLTVDKVANPTSVPTAGGPVDFTLTVQAYDFGPLTSLTVFDLLPAGIPSCAAYVAGSTLITYPDLSQGTADPACAIDPPTGRVRLDWTLSPNTLLQDQRVTIQFRVNIPAGPAATLQNDVVARALLGTSVFRPTASATVVRTDVNVVKTVADDGSPEPGEPLTYTLVVTNNSVVSETGITLTDAIPPGTTFVPGSILNAPPFTGAYSAAQNAVVWTNTGGPFTPGASATLGFQVTIDVSTSAGSVVTNLASYRSAQTPSFNSNTVTTTVVGPVLTQVKTGPALLHPNEIAPFEVQVTNSGAGRATNLLIADPLAASNATYVPGTMEWSLNGGPFAALTDAADADQGTLTGTTVQLLLATLGPGSDVRFRFQARVNPGTGGLFVNNQATVSAAQLPAATTNLLQIPIVGDADLTGRVFLDLDGDGIQDPGEPGVAGVAVTVTDSTGATQVVYTDANGDYLATVQEGPTGLTTVDVDPTTGSLPPGATLTTGNDPQTVTVNAGVTTAAPAVGYQPPPLTVTKASNAGGEVVPGQTVTYTVTVTNNTGVTQTGIDVDDPMPPGTSFVPGSLQVALPTFRVTEYDVAAGFTGTTFTLNLDQNLAADYFAIVQGSDGTGADVTDRPPSQNYAAVTNDPFGTGDFAGGIGASQLQLTRGSAGSAGGWVGVVTVVECLRNCTTSGFRLLDVQRVAHAGAGTAGADASAVAWNLGQVMLMGGFNGAGCDTAEATAGDAKVCHARLFPSGANAINWTRNAGGATSLSTATSTVMVVEWGSDWTVNRQRVNGTAGGNGANAPGEYANSAAFPAVARASTWVWGTGHTNDNGIGDAAEGVLITLGNGVAQNATETIVSTGIEFVRAMDFEVWALTHPSLAVGHVFKVDGDAGANTVNVAVPYAASNRMAIGYNGQGGTGNEYPRPMFSARYTNGNTVQLRRRRPGIAFPAWVQGIGFSNILSAATPPSCPGGTCPPNLVVAGDGYSLAPGETMAVTFQVVVDNPLAPAVTDVTNTVTVDTTQQAPRTASVTDVVVRPSVVVEPNDAGFAPAGTSITFTHVVTNTASFADSFNLTTFSQRGWPVELIDPTTGIVLASDLTGDGVWDTGGPTFSTGSLASGASRTYRVRVSVPAGTLDGVQDTVRLVATSSRGAAFNDDAREEITALAAAALVVVTPDNSGVVIAGSSTVYSHWVVNRTGAPDTFDLYVNSTLGWTTTIHADTNGDGVYTPGVDLVVANTALLAAGASQRIFVVTNAPAGTPAGTRDVANITAASRATPGRFGAASDTTTVIVNARQDLSGGGTRLVAPGDTAIHPGTLLNLGTAADRFELEVSAAGLRGFDALNHPTQLYVDTNGDDLADLLIATDSDGDGVWDTVTSNPLYNADGDGFPDIAVGAGATVAYELRRAVDPAQVLERDLVTVTSRSMNDPGSDPDSVTATWVFAAVTRASIRGLRVDPAGLVEFATGNQNGTASFQIYETDDPKGAENLVPLHDARVVSPVPDSIRPILYRVETRPVTRPYLMIQETEVDGDRFMKGPFAVGDSRLELALRRIEARMDRIGVPQGPARVTRLRVKAPRPFRDRPTLSRLRRRPAQDGVRIEVEQAGLVQVSAADLAATGFDHLKPGALQLWSQGRRVPLWIVADGTSWRLTFRAETLSTDYTDRNVYLLTRGQPYGMTASLTRSAPPLAAGFTRVERNVYYLPGGAAGADPWAWDFVADGNWPVPDWDPTAGDFDLPGLIMIQGTSAPVSVRLQVVGYTKHLHTLTAAINGYDVGWLSFEGAAPATLEGTVPAQALRASGNQLTISYTSGDALGATAGEGLIFVDSLDLAAPVTQPSQTVPAAALEPYDPGLPSLRGVDYLIVTHPLFRAQADRIAAAKSAEGLTPAVVETEDAYDRYSGGIVEARAIQALLRDAARKSRALRYVLLVGDASFDPRDFTGSGAASFVPALFARDSVFGRVPSENLYADLDGDGRPDLAIGRLPVTTAEEADLLADKIVGQAAALAPYAAAHLLVTDNTTSTDAPFRDEAEAASLSVPDGVTPRWSDVADGAGTARAALQAAWRDGVAVTHYFGHGGFTEWADEGLLTADDAAALGATWRPTALFAWACLSQWHIDTGRSVNEALLFVPGGGALASFGPAGITAPSGHRVLADKVYAELYKAGVTVGEAIRRGKAAAIDGRQSVREVVEGFNLLGDPALRLPRPAPQPE